MIPIKGSEKYLQFKEKYQKFLEKQKDSPTLSNQTGYVEYLRQRTIREVDDD